MSAFRIRLPAPSLCIAFMAGVLLSAYTSEAARPVEAAFVSIHRQENQASVLHVSGTLVCDVNPCTHPQLKDEKTGRLYDLDANSGAAEMYQSGTRKVLIEGTQSTWTSLQVSKVEKM